MRLLATAALCTALVAPPRLRQKPRRCMALASTKASAAQRAWNATRAAPLLLPGCVLAACGRPGPAVAALGLGAAATAALSQDLRQTARDRFRANPWGCAVATPLTAAFVGWFTNWVGVQMLFYPLAWRAGQDKSATFPTSKAHLSVVFHSFWLILGRAIISRNGLEAWMGFP